MSHQVWGTTSTSRTRPERWTPRIAPPLVAGLVVGLVSVLPTAPAYAVTDRWASWSAVGGTPNAYRLTMTQRSPGFPVATVASDSRSPVQVASGTSSFLSPATAPGAKYGSSFGNPYLVLRARADTPTGASTTTYTFEHPTPNTGWAFVLGDIDADQVTVSATDATGGAVSGTEVDSWVKEPFNFSGGTDRPTWDAATSTLTGNPGAVDSDGAAGWFEPDVRLSSLTLTFTRRAGFPVYQTWFVSRARPIGGTVDDVSATGSCPPGGTRLTLVSPSGEDLATTSPAADGTYSFGEHATQPGYTVRLDVPAGCAVRGPAEQGVSNAGNDNDAASRADFDVRAIVPQPVSGTVRDTSGAPVAGVTVRLTGPGGPKATTTASDGSYLFDDNPIGTGYTVAITIPDGYAAGPAGTEIVGIAVANAPVTGRDFTVVDLPAVSGTVTGGGAGLGGVQVIVTPVGGGPSTTAATTGDGSYEIDGLPPGAYTLDVVPPRGWTGPPPRTVTVPDTGLTGQDIPLSRLGALGGTITRDGTPVGGVTVTVDGPGGTRTLQSDAEGQYFLDALPAGTYTITLAVPPGTSAAGPTTRSVTITPAGEVRGGQDFPLVTAVATPPPPGTPLPGRPDVDLVLHKRAVTGPRAEVGGAVRYRLTVRNRGADPTRRPVTVVDRLPAGLELVSARGRGWTCTSSTRYDTARCELRKRVAAGRTASPVVVLTRATAAATGRVVNIARARTARESRRSNNTGSAAVTIVPAHLPATGFREAPRAAATCTRADVPFAPVSLSIDDVLPPTEVLPRGRDRGGVPQPPPLTTRGRWQLAWDRTSRVQPGDATGVVRLTAHTYPRGRDDRSRPPALGNLLLARLHPGATIRVTGPSGQRLCYLVRARQQVRATAPLPAYYAIEGPPRLAILVCSGTRRGPGDWTHRSVWWAEPSPVRHDSHGSEDEQRP